MKKTMIALLVCWGWASAVEAAPVDINSADARTLDTQLRNVGPDKAQAIVQYRTEHGPFRSVDDLVKVKGIGKKTVEANRANLITGSSR